MTDENTSIWRTMQTAPEGERILICQGHGEDYTVHDVLWPDENFEPDGWMPRPVPPVWTETAEAIERVLDLPSGSVMGPYEKPRGKAEQGRKLFCWIARNRYGYSLSDIARAVKRHHTTVLKNAESVESRLDYYIETIEKIDSEVRHLRNRR